MNYYGTKDLVDAFRTVRKNTIQIAEDIPESKYSFRAAPDTRTVAQTLAHIAIATRFQQHVHGNKITDMATVNFGELFQQFGAEENRPRTKTELIAFLKSEGDKFASFLQDLPESTLGERISLPPGAEPASKTRFEMLLGSKEHEMHHRAQLMTLERMIGIVPHLTRLMEERMARTQSATQAQAHR